MTAARPTPRPTANAAPDGMRLPECAELVERSTRSLPFSMAGPLSLSEQAREEADYKEALTHLLDFFEMSVQWLNAWLLARLAPMAAGADATSIKSLARVVATIDGKRPLSFGDNVNELLQHLMAAAVRMLPDDALVASLARHVVSAKFNILAGSAKRIGVVKVRNDFKGHSTALAQQFYARALDSLSTNLHDMLLGLEPLHAYTFTATDGLGRSFDVSSADEHHAETASTGGEAGHYYVAAPGGEAVDLFPLAILHDGHVFLFQTLKDESACYESSSREVHRFDTEAHNPAIDAFFRRIVPSFDVAREANWSEILAATAAHSRAYLLQVQKEKKFSSELFVERAGLTRLLARFEADSRTLMPLPGEAGQGKTNQLCHWASEMLDEGSRAVLIFNSADFGGRSLPATLRDIMGSSRRRNIERVLKTLHTKASDAGRNVYFLFDALNECLSYAADDGSGAADEAGPVALFRDILRLLVRPDRPRFKVVATCRVYTWKNAIVPATPPDDALTFRPDNDADGTDYSIGGFTPDETKEAYRIYGQLYQMGSDFDSIDRRILLRLRDPLTLKYACGNHVGKPFPADPAHFTSVSLFAAMTADIRSRSFAGRLQCELLEELADRLLDSYLAGRPAGSISSEALREAVADTASPLHRLAGMVYTHSGVSVAYAELLRNPERPILKESVRSADGRRTVGVEFIYERFLEYAMAEAFLRRMAGDGGHVKADAYVRVFDRARPNVVLIGTLRNALLIDMARGAGADTLLELIALHSTRPDVLQLVTDTTDALIRENYEAELTDLIGRMLDAAPRDPAVVQRYNAIKRDIAADRATPEAIAEFNALAERLAPVMRLRGAASTALGSTLLGDYFNEGLCRTDPMQLLWRVMQDSITDVSDEMCKQVYYLSRHRRTRFGTRLRENLTARIVRNMFAEVRSRPLVANIAVGRHRQRLASFVETGVRLAVLLIIDACMAAEPDDAMVAEMLGHIRGIAGYVTARFTLVRAAMPFLQTVMRKQITFQSEYVNNAIEYQSFWRDEVVPPTAPDGHWSRARLAEAMSYVGHYERMLRGEADGEAGRFAAFRPCVLSAYGTGCAFTYFILERLLVVMGTADWANIRPVMAELLAEGHDGGKWTDYSQMSLLYVLYQVQLHSAADNAEILALYTRLAPEWTRRCRGRFRARNSARANPTGLYKRNVMTWYGAVCCAHTGDGTPRAGEKRCAPEFYSLIDQAVAEADKEMLFHILDNISEMVCDCGLIELPLQLMRHILASYGSAEELARLDASTSPNPAHDGQTLVTLAGRVLSMAHRFFPERTRRFLQADVAGLSFPGVAAYREEILGNITDREKLSDLFTHRFGNFLMWSLLHNEAVDRFAVEAVVPAATSRDCFAWYDKTVRTLCRHLFNIRIK